MSATPDHKGQASVDQAKVAAYVATIAAKIYIKPQDKNVTFQNGVMISQTEGKAGLAADQPKLTANIVAAVNGAGTSSTIVITTLPVAFKTLTNNSLSLDGKYIEVNLSSQHLWAYRDHQLLYDSAVTSGAAKWGLGTVTGLFSIYYKSMNTHLVGPGYDVPVTYWMPFYKGYGLHDAAWRDGVFGGPDYFWNGSHGCVNLPFSTAVWLYGWAPVGTPVWVHN